MSMAGGPPSNPSYPSYGAAPSPSAPRQPSMVPVWLGVVVLVVGVGGSIVWFVTGAVGLVNRINDMPRVSVPGQATVALTAGSYRIYAEYSGATSDSGPADDLGPISVTDSSSQSLTVSEPDIEDTYSVGPHEGRLVGTFTAPSDGSYTIAIAEGGGLNGSLVSGMDLAVSKGPALFSSSNLAKFGFALLLGALSALVGVILLVIGLIRRSRWRRAQMALTGPTWMPPSAGPYGAPPGVPSFGTPPWVTPPPSASPPAGPSAMPTPGPTAPESPPITPPGWDVPPSGPARDPRGADPDR